MRACKIIVAGDLQPSKENISLFEKGDVVKLFGKEVCRLIAEADFSIANLEGSLTDSTIAQDKEGPKIKAPKSTITGIKKLGLSAVSLANNHFTDFLDKGCLDTIEVLESAGIKHVGAVLIKEDRPNANKYLSIVINGFRVCIYAVSETFFNTPTKNNIGAYVYDEWIVLNDIKKLKSEHDFLMVIYHGGAEYFPYPTPQTRLRFQRMAECGADFITAQHTHCIGCEEWYNNSYLLYGQGNFHFARQKNYPSLTQSGLLTEICLSDDGFSIKNHIVNIKDNVLLYDENQDLSSFKERSKRVGDDEYIIEQYKDLKVREIMRKYLLAAKGDYPLRRVFTHIFPKYHLHPEKTYSHEQLLRNFNVVQGERRKEDMYYVLQYLIENSK